MTHFSKFKRAQLSATVLATALFSAPGAVSAGTDPYLGEIMQVAFGFCPRGWVEANGALLPISQYSALFSLYGTTFGGDGRTTFAVPDLQGRLSMGAGAGPGLTSRTLGQRGGTESHTLSVAQMPSHSHAVNANNLDGDKPGPGGKLLAAAPSGGTGDETIYSSEAATTTMSPTMIAPTGNGQPFPIMNPYTVTRFCIARDGGVYPSRP